MASSPTSRREAFRALLNGPGCVRPASVFDPLSARIAQDIGFEAMMLAGSTASLAVLGAPDMVLMTLVEFAEQARRVTRASDIPLLVDADHGFGNALNAMRTVAELEHAGVAALTIEDTDLPTPFGTVDTSRLISLDEGVGKIRAALAGRSDPSLVVSARTGALKVAGLDEAVLRCRAYEQAGADAIYLTGVSSREQLDAISAATTIPIIIGTVPRAIDDLHYLASRRARLALQGHKSMAVAYGALHDAMSRLRNGAHPSTLDDGTLEGRMKHWSQADLFENYERQFLAPQQS